ncbi:MAG: endonuclease III domain-containing protein [Candidatus Thermoplasmatota archaeon]|nr:endonuclease III domain-containing protein [Candidatus Thermoplasmatota archaeon]
MSLEGLRKGRGCTSLRPAKGKVFRQEVTTASGGKAPDGSGTACAEILRLYGKCSTFYGRLGWWPAESPFEVCVGAVLTQNTSWRNVERALENIRAGIGITPYAVVSAGTEKIQQLIRPSGFYRQKARTLIAFSKFAMENFGGDITRLGRMGEDEARKLLLGIRGIGNETADSMLLYACGIPSFVVDAYTRRLFHRIGIADENAAYDSIKLAVEKCTGKEFRDMQQLHALIVEHSKRFCRKNPLCGECFYRADCRHGKMVRGTR